jgi:hypothetical protein
MKVATFTAKCGRCRAEFSCPGLGDFVYGQFLFTGELGTVFAHFAAVRHPVWEFIRSILTAPGDRSDDETEERELGSRIQAACAHFADRIAGQRLVNHRVCPVCQSSDWEWWQGERVGWLEVPAASYNGFLAMPEAERRRLVRDFDAQGK